MFASCGETATTMMLRFVDGPVAGPVLAIAGSVVGAPTHPGGRSVFGVLKFGPTAHPATPNSVATAAALTAANSTFAFDFFIWSSAGHSLPRICGARGLCRSLVAEGFDR